MIRIATIILSIIFISCTATKTQESSSVVSFRTLDRNNYSGIQEPKQDVYTNKADFEKAWNLAWSNFEEPVTLPTIDFTKETVALVALGMKNNGGYQLKIDQITQDQNNLTIDYTETTPNPKCSYTMAIVFPYEFVVFAKTSKKVVFKENSKVGECK
jgi:hypothetical protein